MTLMENQYIRIRRNITSFCEYVIKQCWKMLWSLILSSQFALKAEGTNFFFTENSPRKIDAGIVAGNMKNWSRSRN